MTRRSHNCENAAHLADASNDNRGQKSKDSNDGGICGIQAGLCLHMQGNTAMLRPERFAQETACCLKQA